MIKKVCERNIKFGSHFEFENALSAKQTIRIINALNAQDPLTPYGFDSSQKRISEFTSMLDENDEIVKRILKEIGAVIKKVTPSLEYFTKMFTTNFYGDTKRARSMAEMHLSRFRHR